jgi:serine/threonine protein kinase
MHALVCPLCHIALPPVDDVCARDGHTGREVPWLPVPATLSHRFQVLEPFAHGATGSLYIADEPETGRRGLLKILGHVAKDQLGERQRLRRELVKQSTLVRTHLVVPLASGESEGSTWLFREWLDGVALEVRLSREGALPQTEALAIAAQIASALDELHRGGLLHRDVKPGHIFLQPTPHGIPRALLLDAGLPPLLPLLGSRPDDPRAPTRGAPLYGTAGYIAPEQLLGKLVSFRSDLYSLGCTLYRMLTGRPAFAGDSLDETLAAQRYGELPPMPADLPNGIGALLQSILAKDPQQRPFSAQKLRRTLDPFLPDGALMEKQPTTTFETMPEPKASVAPQPSGTLRPPAPPSVRPSLPAPAGSMRPPTTHSAPPPPPPRTGAARPAVPREDGTQQIDISQIEEMGPALTKRAVSVPPPPAPAVASSLPPPPPPMAKPAAVSEKTQPIRLDQILAVNHARATASSPPPARKEPTHEEPALPPLAEAAPAARKVEAPQPPAALAEDGDLDDSDHENTTVQEAASSLSQRPLFAVQDEPFAPAHEQREEPTLFATARAAAESSSAKVASSSLPLPPADLSSSEADFLSSAQPPVSVPSFARKATLMGMGMGGGAAAGADDAADHDDPGLDPSLEMPTQELRTREFDGERDHPTERVPHALASDDGDSESGVDPSLSLTEGMPSSAPSGFRDSRRMLMYASAALVGLALLGVGASALWSGPEASASRTSETAVPPPLPAALPTPVAEPAPSAVALAEAPHPTVEPLGPSVTSLAPLAESASTVQADPAAAVAAAAVEPLRAAPVVEPVKLERPASKHTHGSHSASKRADEAVSASSHADEPRAATTSKRAESSARRDKASSASAKSSTKSVAPDKDADKAALFAAARDEARNAYAAKKYNDAAAAYERAAKYDPKHPGTFAGLGAARLQLGENKAAVQAYQRAVQLSPETSGFHAALGRAYLALGDKPKALAAYKKALAVDPKNEAAKTAIKQLGG